jgi:hypothetical protein
VTTTATTAAQPPSYRIGEVADATGFPLTTLRYYEDQGLLPPPERTPAGHRVYRDHAKVAATAADEHACGPQCGCAPALGVEPCNATSPPPADA